MHAEAVSAFPCEMTVVWLDQAGSGGSPLELHGMGNTNELGVEMPKLLLGADSKDPAGSSMILSCSKFASVLDSKVQCDAAPPFLLLG